MDGAPEINRPPEMELLLDCVRVQAGQPVDASIYKPDLPTINWQEFLRLAQRHRVVPQAVLALRGLADSSVPSPVVERLSKLQLKIARRNIRLANELGQIFREFDALGIQAFAFKGPLLAVELYGGLHCRQFIDLDILIRPEDLIPTLEMLQKRGYTNTRDAINNLSGRRLSNFLRRFKSHTVIDSGGTYSVDIHWRLSEDPQLYDVPFDEVLTSESFCEIAGRPFPVMPTEQALAYHAFHACKHGCTRLSWLCDFMLLAARISDNDWNGLLESRDRKSARMIVSALMMLEQLSLTEPLDDRISNMDSWRRKLGSATQMMLRALCSDDEKAIDGTNVGLLRWKLSGDIQCFTDSLLRAFLPKQNDLAESGILKPHISRWNHLVKRTFGKSERYEPSDAPAKSRDLSSNKNQ